jgi:hypothetical protein
MSKITAALADANSIHVQNLNGDPKAHTGFISRVCDAFKKDPITFVQTLAVVGMTAAAVLNVSAPVAAAASMAYMSNKTNINNMVKSIVAPNKPKT